MYYRWQLRASTFRTQISGKYESAMSVPNKEEWPMMTKILISDAFEERMAELLFSSINFYQKQLEFKKLFALRTDF